MRENVRPFRPGCGLRGKLVFSPSVLADGADAHLCPRLEMDGEEGRRLVSLGGGWGRGMIGCCFMRGGANREGFDAHRDTAALGWMCMAEEVLRTGGEAAMQ